VEVVELASLLIWKHNVTAWETNRRYEYNNGIIDHQKACRSRYVECTSCKYMCFMLAYISAKGGESLFRLHCAMIIHNVHCLNEVGVRKWHFHH
jgi:hypothetical protein